MKNKLKKWAQHRTCRMTHTQISRSTLEKTTPHGDFLVLARHVVSAHLGLEMEMSIPKNEKNAATARMCVRARRTKRAKCPFLGWKMKAWKSFPKKIHWKLASRQYRTLNLESGVTVVCSCIYDTIVDPKDTNLKANLGKIKLLLNI